MKNRHKDSPLKKGFGVLHQKSKAKEQIQQTPTPHKVRNFLFPITNFTQKREKKKKKSNPSLSLSLSFNSHVTNFHKPLQTLQSNLMPLPIAISIFGKKSWNLDKERKNQQFWAYDTNSQFLSMFFQFLILHMPISLEHKRVDIFWQFKSFLFPHLLFPCDLYIRPKLGSFFSFCLKHLLCIYIKGLIEFYS